jgi:hypothetical protein
MAAMLTTGSPAGSDAPARHVAPARRAGQGRPRPPTRRRPVGAQHVVAAPDCGPRRSPMPVALLVAVALTVAALVYGFGAFAGSMAESTVPEATAVARVGLGESLSDVAVRMAPGSDVSAVVERIIELNGLSETVVYPGQPLTVPSSRG